MAPSRPLLLNQIGAPVAGVLAEYAQQVRILPVGNANTCHGLRMGRTSSLLRHHQHGCKRPSTHLKNGGAGRAGYRLHLLA